MQIYPQGGVTTHTVDNHPPPPPQDTDEHNHSQDTDELIMCMFQCLQRDNKFETRCTRGDVRSFFLYSQTYLNAQNEISFEYTLYSNIVLKIIFN